MRKLITKIYQLSLLLLVFWGGHAWFTWSWDFYENKQKFVLYFLFSTIALFYALFMRVKIRLSAKLIICIFCYIMASFVNAATFNSFLFILFSIIPLIILLCDNKHCPEHLEFITKALAVILVPGIFLYGIVVSGHFLPGIPVQYGDLSENFSYLFLNHIFLLTNVYWEGETSRFYSVFLEPGYLGSLLAFILYANRYDFKKKYNLIVLLALVATFSLAGYITSLIGYLLQRKHIFRTLMKSAIPVAMISGALILFAVNYNNGDNYINVLLVDRLMPSDDGGIKGNTRKSDKLDLQLESTIRRGEIWFGSHNLADDDVSNAGYKRYLITNGLVPTLLWLIFYLLVGSYCHDKRYGFGFVFIIALTFLQAAYPNAYSWLIPVFLGVKSYRSL